MRVSGGLRNPRLLSLKSRAAYKKDRAGPRHLDLFDSECRVLSGMRWHGPFYDRESGLREVAVLRMSICIDL